MSTDWDAGVLPVVQAKGASVQATAERELRIREDGAGAVLPLGEGGGEGRDVPVVVLREGLALSGRYFSRGSVEDVARLANGARAFADHPTPSEDRERPVRSIGDLVGVYREARVETGEDGRAEVRAVLRLFPSAEWLAAIMREGMALGTPVVGISIDSRAQIRIGVPDGMERPVPVVESVVELRSADVVTRPSAGGGFLTVQEAEMVDQMEHVTHTEEQAPELRDAPPQAQSADVVREARAAQEAAERILAEVREAQLRLDCDRVLTDRVGRASLPAPLRARLLRDYAPDPVRWPALETYTAVVEAAVTSEIEALPSLRALIEREAPPTIVTGYGAVRVEATGAERQRVLAQLAMDRLFDVAEGEEDPHWRRGRELGILPSVPRWHGIREAYVQLTGDALVTGTLAAELSIIREANEVTTGVLNHALLNSMTKRLVMDYRGQAQDWRKFCSVVPLRDFRSQDRVKLHDFASLSTVAEGAAYTNLAWDDSREAYAPAKRGNLVVVTREAILNDNLNAIGKIPPKLARTAGMTINEFVFGLFTGNPTMADGSKVFDDGVQTTHANRGTAVLSNAALEAAATSMLKQTDTAGKRLNLRPKYLLVPADLSPTAAKPVLTDRVVGSNNNDVNLFKGLLEPITVAQFTDATDWYLICAPSDIESIEIGFVNGREEPELLLQDAPLLGQVFTKDQITFKVRWEFGGAWLDYRGAFWSQAAG